MVSAAIIRTNLDQKKKKEVEEEEEMGCVRAYIESDARASGVKRKKVPTLAVARGHWERKTMCGGSTGETQFGRGRKDVKCRKPSTSWT